MKRDLPDDDDVISKKEKSAKRHFYSAIFSFWTVEEGLLTLCGLFFPNDLLTIFPRLDLISPFPIVALRLKITFITINNQVVKLFNLLHLFILFCGEVSFGFQSGHATCSSCRNCLPIDLVLGIATGKNTFDIGLCSPRPGN